jgi:predicted lipoprotein with Yx(FWY)xxD motif
MSRQEWSMHGCLRILLILLHLFVFSGLGFAKESDAIKYAPAEVQTQQTPAGIFLKDAQGKALYFDGRDSGGAEPKCTSQCLKEWTAIAPGQKSKPAGDWAIVKSADGGQQWAYKKRRLYSYVKDTYPDARFGDGVDNIWRVAFIPAPTPPGIDVASTTNGYLLVNADGYVLYSADEGARPQTCADDCLIQWTPVLAPLVAAVSGPWSVVRQANGQPQWAYHGKALYAGSIHRDRITEASLTADLAMGWRAQILIPARPKPSWLTIQNSDMGPILANQNGATLYAFEGQMAGMMQMACNADCLRENWKPLEAAENEKPVGDWSVVKAEGARYQWAYKGDPLFIYLKDEMPGHVRGDRFGGFHKHRLVPGSGWWRPLLAACMCMPP